MGWHIGLQIYLHFHAFSPQLLPSLQLAFGQEHFEGRLSRQEVLVSMVPQAASSPQLPWLQPANFD
jgi:hypothetical protein